MAESRSSIRDHTYRQSEEAESHSSALTNERIFRIKEVVWQTGYSVMSQPPNPVLSNEWYTALMQLFQETSYFYEKGVNRLVRKALTKAINKGYDYQRRVRLNLYMDPTMVEDFNLICNRIQYLLNKGMQNLGYFTRISKTDVRGIDGALFMFEDDDIEEDNIEDQESNEIESLFDEDGTEEDVDKENEDLTTHRGRK